MQQMNRTLWYILSAAMVALFLLVLYTVIGFVVRSTEAQDYYRQTPTIYNTTLTSSATEYSRALPNNTKKVLIQERTGTRAIRYCYTSTCTASTYMTLPAGASKSLEDIDLVSKTLYFQDPTNASTVVETEVFTDE